MTIQVCGCYPCCKPAAVIAAGLAKVAAVVIVDHLETLSGLDIPIPRYDYAYVVSSGPPFLFLFLHLLLYYSDFPSSFFFLLLFT